MNLMIPANLKDLRILQSKLQLGTYNELVTGSRRT